MMMMISTPMYFPQWLVEDDDKLVRILVADTGVVPLGTVTGTDKIILLAGDDDDSELLEGLVVLVEKGKLELL